MSSNDNFRIISNADDRILLDEESTDSDHTVELLDFSADAFDTSTLSTSSVDASGASTSLVTDEPTRVNYPDTFPHRRKSKSRLLMADNEVCTHQNKRRKLILASRLDDSTFPSMITDAIVLIICCYLISITSFPYHNLQ